MRDQNRISKIMPYLTALWASNPDLRFNQLVDMVDNRVRALNGIEADGDTYYIEDDKVLEAIEDLIAGQG